MQIQILDHIHNMDVIRDARDELSPLEGLPLGGPASELFPGGGGAICQPAGHPFTLHPVEPDDLCDETLLLREQGSGTRRYFELELERQGVKLRRVLEIGNTEAIKRAVAAGLGISAVPRRSLTEEVRGSLELVKVVGLDLQRPLGILTYKGIRLAPVALAFSAALQKASF